MAALRLKPKHRFNTNPFSCLGNMFTKSLPIQIVHPYFTSLFFFYSESDVVASPLGPRIMMIYSLPQYVGGKQRNIIR